MAKAEPAVSAAEFLPKERSLVALRESSAILRGDPELCAAEFAAFVDDLRFVASLA